MKPKFKVGDLVRGNRESDKHYDITNSCMTKGIVTKVCTNGYINVRVLEHKRGNMFNFTFWNLDPECFDKIESNDWKVLIIPDGDKTIGKLFENGKLTTTVETKKHPRDEYSINEAIKSITARLVEEHDERKHKFKIGDIVELTNSYSASAPNGIRGEVVSADYSHETGKELLGVDFKFEYDDYTHNLNGKLLTDTGRYLFDTSIKLVYRK